MSLFTIRSTLLAWTIAGVCASALAADAADPARRLQLRMKPAAQLQSPERSSLLGMAATAKRLVAVGDLGTIVVSDNGGLNWRQAAHVPVRSTLTSVSFIDDRRGWVAGHDGVILHTSDGGENWKLQRFEKEVDRPLFGIHMMDDKRGVAVGLWSLILTTEDGGKTWTEVKLQPPPGGGKADRNLFGVFANAQGWIFAVAERGSILRSKDSGRTWQYLDTGYKGSFWTGTALPAGGLLVGGMRGSLYRSDNGGETWRAVDTGTTSSLTSIAATQDGVTVVGLEGVILRSNDAGRTFKFEQRGDRMGMTAVVNPAGKPVILSRQGPVAQ